MKITCINEGLIIPSVHYGGSERMFKLLFDSLIEKGHTVNLLAGAGSKVTECRLLTYKLKEKTNYFDRFYRRLDFSLKSFRLSINSDIVHTFKFWPNYHFILNNLKKPIIYRQGNSINPDDFLKIKNNNPKYGFMQCISKSQIRNLKGLEKDRVFFIPNATDTDLICPPKKSEGNYMAFLGRLNYIKGIDIAVKISLSTGIPLKIAGVLRPHEYEAKSLFDEKVKPYLGKNIEFIGPINDSQKREFLGNAICLLMPNRWEEPFGIVMIEALAAGTPVIGTNKGSIPEIIDHGINGFVCNSLNEMIDSIKNIHTIDRKKCREKAVNEYSKEKYISNILSMYKTVQAKINL